MGCGLWVVVVAELAQNQNNYNGTEAELDEEERLAFELEAEQEHYAAQEAAVELYNQGQEYRRPSLFKYSILASFASIVDLIDLIDLTGFGAILGRIVSFVVTAVILLIFWFTNTKQKRADEYVKNIEKSVEYIAQRVASAERNIVRVARLSRHVPGAKQLYRKLHLRTIRRARVGLRKVAKSTKNPIVRSAASGALNLVPFLAVIPWMLVGVWLSYRAEKESYKNAREASDSVLEATGETTTV